MGGQTKEAQAPTPPAEDEMRKEVENCLEIIISLVMKYFYSKQLANARRNRKKKEKREKDKFKKK